MRNELLLRPFSEDAERDGGGGNGKKARLRGVARLRKCAWSKQVTRTGCFLFFIPTSKALF